MTAETSKNFSIVVQHADEMMTMEPFQDILVSREVQGQSNLTNLDVAAHDSDIMNYIEDIQHHSNNEQNCFLNDIDSMLS